MLHKIFCSQNILSQRKYINLEENHQGNQKYKTKDFIDGHWSLKNKNKQVKCAIPVLTTPILNRKISVKTSNSMFQQSDSLNQSCRRNERQSRTSKTKYTNFPKTITQRWMKTNTPTQTRKCSYFNYLENRLSLLADYANVRSTSEMDENREKKVTRKNNACIIKMDISSSQILIWPRIKRHNIYSAFQTREDVNAHSKEPLSQICDQTEDWRNWRSLKASCPLCCNHISAEKRKTLMSYLTNYSHFPPTTLNFDMSNVSGRLYDCLEKLEDITA